ncbi:uncharacterized protein V1510DRAFT_416816 [Dipodascopsis tothii]|uniref:uncharacterized protein n=1 Tax=Dipodascopsis tothii TaxID=44089 RepID=UPI0034CE7144
MRDLARRTTERFDTSRRGENRVPKAPIMFVRGESLDPSKLLEKENEDMAVPAKIVEAVEANESMDTLERLMEADLDDLLSEDDVEEVVEVSSDTEADESAETAKPHADDLYEQLLDGETEIVHEVQQLALNDYLSDHDVAESPVVPSIDQVLETVEREEEPEEPAKTEPVEPEEHVQTEALPEAAELLDEPAALPEKPPVQPETLQEAATAAVAEDVVAADFPAAADVSASVPAGVPAIVVAPPAAAADLATAADDDLFMTDVAGDGDVSFHEEIVFMPRRSREPEPEPIAHVSSFRAVVIDDHVGAAPAPAAPAIAAAAPAAPAEPAKKLSRSQRKRERERQRRARREQEEQLAYDDYMQNMSSDDEADAPFVMSTSRDLGGDDIVVPSESGEMEAVEQLYSDDDTRNGAVRNIAGKKTVGGRTKYLVEFSRQSTWVDAEDLMDAQHVQDGGESDVDNVSISDVVGPGGDLDADSDSDDDADDDDDASDDSAEDAINEVLNISSDDSSDDDDDKELQLLKVLKSKTRSGTGTDDFDYVDIPDAAEFWEEALQMQAKRKLKKSFVPDFNLSDPELEAQLRESWKRDRHKKAERKKEREQLRREGLLNKKARTTGAPDLAAKYPSGLTPMQLNDEIAFFLEAEGQTTLSLPPMDKNARKNVHNFAHLFALKSKSVGSGLKRFTVLYKTAKTSYTTPDRRTIRRALEGQRYLPRMDKRGGKGPAKHSPSMAGRPREGAVVGGEAPEIGSENKGRAMLEKMGWTSGSGLGVASNRGMVTPILARVKTGKAGLG